MNASVIAGLAGVIGSLIYAVGDVFLLAGHVGPGQDSSRFASTRSGFRNSNGESRSLKR